jgi:catalase
VGVSLGAVASTGGKSLEVEVSLEAAPSVLWDACIVAPGPDVASALANSGHALEFLKDQHRHCKPMLLLGSAVELLEAAGLPTELPEGGDDPGLLQAGAAESGAAVAEFISALERHRIFERETDPPVV